MRESVCRCRLRPSRRNKLFIATCSTLTPYGMGLLFDPAMLPVLPTPYDDLRPSASRRPFPFPPTYMGAPSSLDKSATTLEESGNGPLFFITRWITRGFGAAYPIMRTHNARVMRKYGGTFSPFVRRHYVGWNDRRIRGIFFSLSLSALCGHWIERIWNEGSSFRDRLHYENHKNANINVFGDHDSERISTKSAIIIVDRHCWALQTRTGRGKLSTCSRFIRITRVHSFGSQNWYRA